MKDQFAKLKGVFPLTSMSFREDGRVDYDAFERLIEYLCHSGADGIGLWGMMSEYQKLDDYERDQLAAIFFQVTHRNHTPSLVSITEWSTEKAVARAREYEQKGADFLMLLPPFYYGPTENDILHHIHSVVAAVSIPVVVQYAPQSTGMYFDQSVIFGLADKYPNIAFKLEHNPQKDFIQSFLAQKPELKVMSGYAGLDMPDLLEIGVRGSMPGCSFAQVHSEIYRLFTAGQKEAARKLYDQLSVYLKEWMVTVEKLIGIEKRMLERRGILTNHVCRHPGYDITKHDDESIDAFLAEFAEILHA